MDKKVIRIGKSEIPYFFGQACMDEIGHRLNLLDADRFIVVTDDTVATLYLESLVASISPAIPITILSCGPGKSLKPFQYVSDTIERALADGASRRSVVVSLGGGTPANLAGVIASLILRGIRLVHVPTTTVAAMDTVLSLKHTVTSGIGNNHVGCYYRPEAIMLDFLHFRSLPGRELRSGFCEMGKNCLAIEPDALPQLWSVLESEDLSDPDILLWLLESSVHAKEIVTLDDAYERRSGLVLEYGHTVGHALELADHARLGDAGLSHGECVAIGMLAAAHISGARGWLQEEEVAQHERLVGALDVPLEVLSEIPTAHIIDRVRDDNKRGFLTVRDDAVPLVLLESVGEPAWTGDKPLVPVRIDEIIRALRELAQHSAGGAVSPYAMESA